MATINGTNGNDTLIGGKDDDAINGRGGNDSILGSGGNDDVLGGGGDDTIDGGDGNDTINGNGNNDIIWGQSGNDDLTGGGGNDTVDGGADNDTIRGEANDDSIFGGSGDDSLLGGGGSDTLDGGMGGDVLYGGTGNDLGIYVASENAGSFDYYDGDGGTDTLRLVLTREEWLRPELQSDITQYLAVIAAGGEEHYTFSSIGLEVRDWESLEVIVLDPPCSGYQVNTYTDDDQYSPDIAALAGGGYVVTWVSEGQDDTGPSLFGLRQGVYAQRFGADTLPLGPEFRVNSTVADEQFHPTVAGLADGGFVTVWASWAQDGSDSGVFGQRFDASGTPEGGEFLINTRTYEDQVAPSVAALTGGGFVVTWQSYAQGPGGGYEIYAQQFDETGTPFGGEFHVNFGWDGGDDQSVSAAGLVDGGYVIVWDDGYPGTLGVMGQRYAADGMPVGTNFRISTYEGEGYDQLAATAVGLADGGFVVIWDSNNQDGDGWGVTGRRYDVNGSPVGGEFQVNTYTAGDQLASDVSALESGGWVVTWMSADQNGVGYGFFGQEYDALGMPQGTEFEVTCTLNDPASFQEQHYYRPIAVAGLADGSFATTWQTFGLDGSGWGIFGG